MRSRAKINVTVKEGFVRVKISNGFSEKWICSKTLATEERIGQ